MTDETKEAAKGFKVVSRDGSWVFDVPPIADLCDALAQHDAGQKPLDPHPPQEGGPAGPRYRVTITRDRKSTRLNSSHIPLSRMPSSA